MSYAVRPLRLHEHREALGRLWAENMSDPAIASAIPDRMRWLYELGPDGPATTVLAIDAGSGQVVGCGSFFNHPTWVDGRRVRAGVLCDFAVTRAHRIAGAALAIQRALAEAGRAAGLELLYGHPNEKSVAVFKRIGYRVVGETTTWVKPLRSAYKLRAVLSRGWAAAMAAAPIDLGLRGLDLARSLRIVGGLRGEIVRPEDGRIDALWERARARYGVVGEKSSAYLGWRYGRFPTAAHQVFAVARPGEERLAAYAVYGVERGKAFLRDLFAEDLDACAEALLVLLARHLRSGGIESVSLSYVGSHAFAERLRRAGFLQRPGKRPLVLHPEGLAASPAARALDPESWFMLDGELDI